MDEQHETAIRSTLSKIETMLRDPTCEISIECSVVHRHDVGTWVAFEACDRERTLTIKINGGARQSVVRRGGGWSAT